MRQESILHYPSLKTVLMVEEELKRQNKPINRSQLKMILQSKVMHQTLNLILEYLEESGKIIDGRKGIIWIFNPSKKLQKAVDEGLEV